MDMHMGMDRGMALSMALTVKSHHGAAQAVSDAQELESARRQRAEGARGVRIKRWRIERGRSAPAHPQVDGQ